MCKLWLCGQIKTISQQLLTIVLVNSTYLYILLELFMHSNHFLNTHFFYQSYQQFDHPVWFISMWHQRILQHICQHSFTLFTLKICFMGVPVPFKFTSCGKSVLVLLQNFLFLEWNYHIWKDNVPVQNSSLGLAGSICRQSYKKIVFNVAWLHMTACQHLFG